MIDFLETALSCVQRGWFVFPCKPKTKIPAIKGAYANSSNDQEEVRAWWRRFPDANVAIAPGRSGLIVLDCDHGNRTREDFLLWGAAVGLPETYTVRTGRRANKNGEPEYGVQMYFSGPEIPTKPWMDLEHSGEVRCGTGHVMAAGSIHPDSGERYELLNSAPVAPAPHYVTRILPTKPAFIGGTTGGENPKFDDDGGSIAEFRNMRMISLLGKARSEGKDDEQLWECAIETNDKRMVPPLGEEELERLIGNACKYPIGSQDPVPVLGGKTTADLLAAEATAAAIDPEGWKTFFHTKDEMENAPPISFLIDGFLQCEGVTAIAAPVRERKSLIALNMAHALVTGEKLFGEFEVKKKPSRVLYLVPEVSLGPWTDRLKRIGLMPYIGDTLFCRTLSSDGALSLNDSVLLPALPGAVVFLDTAIRFLEGDENSSTDVRKFADSIFALLRHGAEAVVMLHHSPKDSGDVMTLENAMRGSGDMGAFLASCWGTKLQDPTKPYESASFVTNLKQRDFESKDFEVRCDPDCRMHIIGEVGEVRLQARKGFKGNKDGKDAAALALIKANPGLPNPKMSALLKEHGVARSSEWVRRHKYEEVQRNGGVMP